MNMSIQWKFEIMFCFMASYCDMLNIILFIYPYINHIPLLND